VRVFLSTGEASGDAYGASLVRALRRVRGDLQIEAVGGSRLRAELGTLRADSSKWGAISILESLKTVPAVIRSYYRVKRELRRDPGLFIAVDFGYVNIRLCRHAKNRGWKVAYFIPPGSWRRDRQGRDIPAIADKIVCPFPWSAEILRGMGGEAQFFGHPIKQLMRESGVPPDRGAEIAVLPGSRSHELAEHVPLIAEAVRDLDSDLIFALAPTVDPDAFRRRWEALSGRTRDRYEIGTAAAVLKRCRAGIVCSGTATLEAALARTPMVVVYRLGKSGEMEAKLIGFKRPKYISLPNIVLDRFAVPELIQENATPANLRATLDGILADASHQLEAFDELDALLGNDDAIDRAAEWFVGETP